MFYQTSLPGGWGGWSRDYLYSSVVLLQQAHVLMHKCYQERAQPPQCSRYVTRSEHVQYHPVATSHTHACPTRGPRKSHRQGPRVHLSHVCTATHVDNVHTCIYVYMYAHVACTIQYYSTSRHYWPAGAGYVR